MRPSAKFSVLLLPLGLAMAGCAQNSDIGQLRQDLRATQSMAQEALDSARQANSRLDSLEAEVRRAASAAESAAQSAEKAAQAAQAAADKADKIYQRAQRK